MTYKICICICLFTFALMTILALYFSLKTNEIKYKIYKINRDVKTVEEDIRKKKHSLINLYGLKKIQEIAKEKQWNLIFPVKENLVKKYITE